MPFGWIRKVGKRPREGSVSRPVLPSLCTTKRTTHSSFFAPSVLVKLYGQSIYALLDTGSAVSLVKASFVKTLPNQAKVEKETSRTFVTASGDSLCILGSILANVAIGTEHYSVDLHIVQDLPVLLLLGNDVLIEKDAIIDLPNGKLRFQSGNSTDIVQLPTLTPTPELLRPLSTSTLTVSTPTSNQRPTRHQVQEFAETDIPFTTGVVYRDQQITVTRLLNGQFSVAWHWKTTPPSNHRPIEPFLSRLDNVHKEAFHQQLQYYIQHGIIREVSTSPSSAFPNGYNYLKWFGIQQKSTSTPTRPIWDFRPVNATIRSGPMRQAHVNHLQHQLRVGHTLVVLDLSKAFLSIQLEKSLWPFTLFGYQGRTFMHTCLGFGVAVAPHSLETILRILIRDTNLNIRLLNGGWSLLHYMDDLLLISITPSPTLSPRDAVELVLEVVRSGGFSSQLQKTRLVSGKHENVFESMIIKDGDESIKIDNSHEAKVLGLIYDKRSSLVRYPKVFSQLLRASEEMTRRQVLSRISQLRDPLTVRPVTSFVVNFMKQKIGESTLSWDAPFTNEDQQIWHRRLQVLEEIDRIEPAEATGNLKEGGLLVICSDASTTGYAWLAFYGTLETRLDYLGGYYGVWKSKHYLKHINYLELLAAVKATSFTDMNYVDTLKPKAVYHLVDSQSCYRQLLSGRVHEQADSAALCQRQLNYHSEVVTGANWQQYMVVHIPSGLNPADTGSRLTSLVDYFNKLTGAETMENLVGYLAPKYLSTEVCVRIREAVESTTLTGNISTISMVTLPKNVGYERLRKVQEEDPDIVPFREHLLSSESPMTIDDSSMEQRQLLKFLPSLGVCKGILVRNYTPFPYYESKAYPIIPLELRKPLLSKLHDKSHYGQAKLYDQALRVGFWPSMRMDCLQYVKQCPICCLRRPPPKPQPLRIHYATEPWQLVSVDVLSIQGQKLLTLCCHFTKWAVVQPIDRERADVIVTTLLRVFYSLGFPRALLSDRGTIFTSTLYVSTFGRLGVDLRYSSVGHPASNGQVERFHRSLLGTLRLYMAQHPQQAWLPALPRLVYTYNITLHSSIGTSPFEAMFGRPPLYQCVPLSSSSSSARPHDETHARIHDYVVGQLSKAKSNYTRSRGSANARSVTFAPGTMVLLYTEHVRSKLQPHWRRGFRIMNKTSSTTYKVMSIESHHVFSCHVDRLVLDPLTPSSTTTRNMRLQDRSATSTWAPRVEEVDSIDGIQHSLEEGGSNDEDDFWSLPSYERLQYPVLRSPKSIAKCNSQASQQAFAPKRTSSTSSKSTTLVTSSSPTIHQVTTRYGRLIRKPNRFQ